jgi:ankyrin repeat protein
MNGARATWLRMLMDAIEDCDADDVTRIVRDGDLNVVDDLTGMTPLQLAVDAGADRANQQRVPPDTRIVRLLLSLGASPTLEGRDGVNAADLARAYGWHEVLDLMHDAAPDTVLPTWWRVSRLSDPRHAATATTENGDSSVAAWHTELMDAIDRGNAERVRSLLATPRSSLEFVHAPSGRTPLQLAVWAGASESFPYRPRQDIEIVRILLQSGASPHRAAHDRNSALELARSFEWTEAVELLERAARASE